VAGVVFNDYHNAWAILPNAPEAGGQAPVGQPVHTAAQTVVISKLLRLGCNVAAVEVDKVLAFQDEEPGFTQIRVKGGSGMAVDEPDCYTVEVELPLAELKFPSDLFYVFPLRFEGQSVNFVVISRERLDDLRFDKDVGLEHVDQHTGEPYLKLTFSVSKGSVRCGGRTLTATATRGRRCLPSLPRNRRLPPREPGRPMSDLKPEPAGGAPVLLGRRVVDSVAAKLVPELVHADPGQNDGHLFGEAAEVPHRGAGSLAGCRQQ